MERFLWICLAGAMGTGLRYLVSLAVPQPTLIVNLAGCFVMGALMQLVAQTPSFPPNLRFALSVGFLGGLTTYSSFNYEATALLRQGSHAQAVLLVGATMVGCFLAGLLGMLIASQRA
jgi:CrcB protein